MERKTKVLKRVPPGDNWKSYSENRSEAKHFESLIDGLNDVYEETGVRKFFIDAEEGYVYTVEVVEDIPTPRKRYALYDE